MKAILGRIFLKIWSSIVLSSRKQTLLKVREAFPKLAHDAEFALGNKKDNITVIYTPWSNLKKDGSMAVGQVGFKDPRKVSRRLCHQSCLLKIGLGKESSGRSKREPYCQSSEQDQSREISGSGTRKGGEIEGHEKERPSCKAGAGNQPF
jgi:hypothetical protein